MKGRLNEEGTRERMKEEAAGCYGERNEEKNEGGRRARLKEARRYWDNEGGWPGDSAHHKQCRHCSSGWVRAEGGGPS